jgi:hypothetical protein
MRRQLILAGRTNGHPFRNHVQRTRARMRKRADDGDLKLFALSYAAFFVCFYTFIA